MYDFHYNYIRQKYNTYFCAANKKVIGKMKDEAAGIPLTEFVGLRRKMYSFVRDNDKDRQDVKTAKGKTKYVIKKNIQHEDYKDTLQNNKQIFHSMNTIRSVAHQLGSYELNKISMPLPYISPL